MPSRHLTGEEIARLNDLQARTVADLERLAQGDAVLLFALRRRLYIRLMYMERSTPARRRRLQTAKWQEQEGRCAICGDSLAQEGSELDRFDPVLGYTAENTRLVHHDCHIKDQRAKGFA